jgi:hypothetical protein
MSGNTQNRKCIAMYVRRGAKAVEMALKPFKDYADAAVLLHERGYFNTHKRIQESPNRALNTSLNNTRKSLSISIPVSLSTSTSSTSAPPNDQRKPLIFIGTEDPSVLGEAIAWGKKNDWQVCLFLSFACPSCCCDCRCTSACFCEMCTELSVCVRTCVFLCP